MIFKPKAVSIKAVPAISAGLAALTALALVPAPALASCTQDGTTVTCSGDFYSAATGGLTYATDDGVDTLIIEDLDGGYQLQAGDVVISLTGAGDDGSDDGDAGSAGEDVTITYDAGDYGFDGYGTALGMEVSSQGGDGAAGEDSDIPNAGNGGNGGKSGAATLNMTSGFFEQEDGTTGLSVSSTGGAGGAGGEDRSTYSATAGNGGDGGDAETTTLTISDLSNPDGSAGIDLTKVVTGITVTSTGGAGGEGGVGRCETPDGSCDAYSGVGGAGGAAGDVEATVTNTDISITDVSGTGIEFVSAGGDGGQGGKIDLQTNDDYSKNGSYYSNNNGFGGIGGAAGDVSFESVGSQISISDDNSDATYGLVLSSKGGAGGNGNDSQQIGATNGDDGAPEQYAWGDGADGGEGFLAELTLEDSEISVSLTADDAVGILVSSTGGDAGDVGYLIKGSAVYDPEEGADGGNGGIAGKVSVTMDSDSVLSVTTSGDGGSMGAITLLSQGGDGGDGGDGNSDSSQEGDGDGGDGGTGGQVVGTMKTVEVTTSGDDAYGIYLASLGGDGGTGAASDGSGGDSDPIDVEISSATVTTTGEGSYGIYAISQGGTGGDASSGGDGGDSDFVTLHVDSGTIKARGKDAYGIAAVSSAGSAGSGDMGASAGDVTLTVGADVTVTRSGNVGLYGESTGRITNGTIDITVDSGGTITASNNATAAVSFVNGDGNALTNNGTITTDDLSSSSIYALTSSGSATLDVTNNGTFSGSVDLSHKSTFTNSSGATFNTGPTLDLGSSGTLTNNGTISPGGTGNIVMTTVTADLVTFGSDSTYLVDFDYDSSTQLITDLLYFDSLNDSNSIAGTVEVNVISAPSSSGESEIAYSSGKFDASDLTVSDTATVDFSLDTTSGSIWLLWDVSMDDSDLLATASSNQSAVAGHLQAVLENGGFGPELASLLNIVDEGTYIKALDSFASQIASDNQLTALFSAQGFSDALLSCSKRDGAYRFVDQDRCAWLRAGASGMERSASAENRPFDQSAWQFAGGGQVEVRDDWFLGSGFSIGTQSLSVDDIAESDGDFYQGGVVAKHTMGNSILSASLTAGYGDYDITRYLFSTDIAKGNETLWTVSGQLSASHAFVKGDWYLKPRFDVAFDHVNMNSFTETGAGGASLTVDGNAQTYYSLQPAIEFGGEIKAANGVLLRPSLSVGLTQFLGDAAPATSASFADTPDGVAPFTIASEFDKTYVDVKAGLEILTAANVSLSAQGFGQFSDNISSYGGSAKLAVRF